MKSKLIKEEVRGSGLGVYSMSLGSRSVDLEQLSPYDGPDTIARYCVNDEQVFMRHFQKYSDAVDDARKFLIGEEWK